MIWSEEKGRNKEVEDEGVKGFKRKEQERGEIDVEEERSEED